MAERVAKISEDTACSLLQDKDFDYDIKKNPAGEWLANLDDAITKLDPLDFEEVDWTPFTQEAILEVGIPKPKPRKPKA